MNKRRVLKLMASSASLAIVAPFIYQNSKKVVEESVETWVQGFQHVAIHWLENEKYLPEQYLAEINLDKKIAELDLIIKSDFKNGETYSLNGLILSKTEVAIMAYLGSNSLEKPNKIV